MKYTITVEVPETEEIPDPDFYIEQSMDAWGNTGDLELLDWERVGDPAPLWVVLQEGDEGVVNVWGPYDNVEDAQTAALIELVAHLSPLSEDMIQVEEESREGPWRISTEYDIRSWAVCQIISLAGEKIHQITKEHE